MKKELLVHTFILLSLVFSGSAYALGTSPWTTVSEIIQGPGSFPQVKIADPGDAGTGCASFRLSAIQ